MEKAGQTWPALARELGPLHPVTMTGANGTVTRTTRTCKVQPARRCSGLAHSLIQKRQGSAEVAVNRQPEHCRPSPDAVASTRVVCDGPGE